MATPSRRNWMAGVDLPGERRTVTGTYRYGTELRSFVAPTIPLLHAKANRVGDGPDECLSISTPRSVYNDLTGYTQQRAGEKGSFEPFMDRSLGTERA